VNAINWDYTDDDWVRISATIQRVRSDPLNDTERNALRIAANEYVVSSRNKSIKRQTWTAERKAWRNAYKMILESQRAIKRAAGITIARRRTADLLFFPVTEEIMAAVLGQLQPSPKTTKIKVKGHWKEIAIPHVSRDAHLMTADEVGVVLSQLKFQIWRFLTTWRVGPAEWWTYSGRLEPRVVYMQQILWLWTDRFGGRLTLSVDSTRIKTRIHGPLVDYVSAVTGPVMKDERPKPSGLRDVLKRQKKFYAWLADYERTRGFKMEPWAYERAAAMRKPHSNVEVALPT
jgi:hypothetical protein